MVAQVIGGIAAGAVLYLIASGKAGFDVAGGGFASNGYGEHSPGGYSFRSEEHTSELQSLMRISYAVFCLKKKIHEYQQTKIQQHRQYKTTQNVNYVHQL